jgi:hypothetical protein
LLCHYLRFDAGGVELEVDVIPLRGFHRAHQPDTPRSIGVDVVE